MFHSQRSQPTDLHYKSRYCFLYDWEPANWSTLQINVLLSIWLEGWPVLNGSKLLDLWNTVSNYLTHSFPMHSFSTPWKHQKTVRFSDVFRGWRKGALGTNGLMDELLMPNFWLNEPRELQHPMSNHGQWYEDLKKFWDDFRKMVKKKLGQSSELMGVPENSSSKKFYKIFRETGAGSTFLLNFTY